ncbi:MAG: TonB-dependent receptor [Campylobacter sp.]|nr:TonB-dependent receptor [Campylobacter sp.]
MIEKSLLCSLRILISLVLCVGAASEISANDENSPILQDQNSSNDANTTIVNSVYLSEVLVESSTIVPVGIRKYAGGVSVLTADDLSASTNVIDAIKNVAGVDGGSDMGRHIAKQFQIRGFGSGNDNRVIIKQDGVKRSAGLYSNTISSFRADSDILKRVEVTKGASSILHGSGAIGGIVSMQTKSASDYLDGDKSFGAMLGRRLESNNMHSHRAAAYAKGDEIPLEILIYGKRATYGNLKLADGGSHYQNTDDRTFNNEHIDTAFVKIGGDFGEHKFSMSMFDYDEKLHTLWQAITANSENLTVGGNLSQRDYVFDYNFTPENNALINTSFKFYKSEAKYYKEYEQYYDLNSAYKEKKWGLELKNISEFDTGFIRHNLVIGMDYENTRQNSIYTRNKVVSVSGYETFPNEGGIYGAYIQNLMQIDRLELTLGGRFDRYDRKMKNSAAVLKDFSDHKFSPHIAAAYEAFDGFNLLAGYSQSFRAPAANEIASSGYNNAMYLFVPNPDLKSETAKEYELGFSYLKDEIFGDDVFDAKFIYFNGTIDDMIALSVIKEGQTPPPGIYFSPDYYGQYKNVDKAKRHGIELSAGYKIDDFKMGASYERLRIYDVGTGENINSHANKLMLSAEYSPFRSLNLGANVSHWYKPYQNPSSYVSRGTTYYYVDKAFTIANFYGSYKLPKGTFSLINGATIGFGVNNIFDKQYINANRTKDTTAVGLGRNFYIDFEAKF